ncbi:PD-(D/E)XK nuclease family protein [Treponema socranskii]|uniref:PD-(D/E)XK nuclease family protein n=1 Tax=Treponema socranskii TaxID=53419 RepID=UPI0028E2A67B|nr:PD-(D/E)XK nuclease family protein [Treponema socranskii]
MKRIELEPARIADVLKENLKHKDTIFVFSTDVALVSWAEWCVKNPQASGVKAVALERFIAWDTFKEKYAVAKEAGRHAVPAVLRKVFVRNLIEENAAGVRSGKPIFKSIVNPQFADDADSFADWIAKNLPLLKTWYEKFSRYASDHPEAADDEDEDYLTLYRRYVDFLGESMFEPAWFMPDFTEERKKFIIFYPEQLEDFDEYEAVFAAVENITSYVLPEKEVHTGEVFVYPDARTELRRTALCIRNIVGKSGGELSYEDIALHVPELETYRPYIERELANYRIPFVVRSGERFTVGSAGSIFEDIDECRKNNYSYDSVRRLVLDGRVPWKNKALNESLVREGNRLHCICNYGEKDVWIEALGKSGKSERELELYKRLKKSIEAVTGAKAFEGLRTAWLIFKNEFLSDDEFSIEANNILGRCIAELETLVAIEKDYIEPLGLKLRSPFSFFINELRSKTYRPQDALSGVSVFDYKVAACAAYPVNIVINCTQDALTVVRKPLGFLTTQKRRALGIRDSDAASTAFIRLYGKFNNAGGARSVFSCSEQTFSGFAIPHTYFNIAPVEKNHTPFDELDADDFILNERKWFLSESDAPRALSDLQKAQYENWKTSSDFSLNTPCAQSVDTDVKKIIDYVLKERRTLNGSSSEDASVVKITQSDMRDFFPCPRKWLFKSVVKLREDSLDASLFEKYDQGNINHKILELLFKSFDTLPVTSEDGTFGERENDIRKLIKEKTYDAICDKSFDFYQSPIALRVLEAQSGKFEKIIIDFLHEFCKQGKGFGGCRVVSTEASCEAWESGKRYKYFGKIDCVLSDDAGRIIIVDYKNTVPPSIASCRADETTGTLKNFQCAMYVTLWNLADPVKVDKMVFCSIKNAGDNTVVIDYGDDKKLPESYAPTLSVFDRYASLFYETVENGNPEPLRGVRHGDDALIVPDVYSDCMACDFKTICRTAYTVASHKL